MRFLIAFIGIALSCGSAAAQPNFIIKKNLARSFSEFDAISVDAVNHKGEHTSWALAVEMYVVRKLGEYGIDTQSTRQPKIAILCIADEGIGFPELAQDSGLTMTYLNAVNIKVVEMHGNVVIGEIEYKRRILEKSAPEIAGEMIDALEKTAR